MAGEGKVGHMIKSLGTALTTVVYSRRGVWQHMAACDALGHSDQLAGVRPSLLSEGPRSHALFVP